MLNDEFQDKAFFKNLVRDYILDLKLFKYTAWTVMM